MASKQPTNNKNSIHHYARICIRNRSPPVLKWMRYGVVVGGHGALRLTTTRSIEVEGVASSSWHVGAQGRLAPRTDGRGPWVITASMHPAKPANKHFPSASPPWLLRRAAKSAIETKTRILPARKMTLRCYYILTARGDFSTRHILITRARILMI